jgi:hypothetical protein
MLVDLDLLPSGHSVALIEPSRGQLLLSFDDEEPVEFKPGMDLRSPIVRLAREKTAVIVDENTPPGTKNAWVADGTGRVQTTFSIGNGVEDVLARGNSLVVTYFDEGVFRYPPPSAEGLALFSLDGEFLIGYNSGLSQGAFISDCYCACWRGPSEVCFSPYTDFPLICLDIERRTQQVWELPEAVHGASALVPKDDGWYFYRHGEILWWKPGDEPRVIASHSGRLRGLWDGRFLDRNSHTVVQF